MPYIGKQPLTGAYQLCDTITTSATATYNLLVGGSAVIPGSAQNCIVSLNGVIQAPVSAFTVSGSTITFASTLSATDVIDFILILGNVFDIGKPTNGTVTPSSIQGGTSGLFTWQSVQTTGFTAVAGRAYPCNTTSASFTVTLPATPSVGQQVLLLDYAGTADTNAIIINPNGNKIEGATSNLQLSGEREGVTLTYVDSTQGWLATSGINEGTDALQPTTYSADFLVIAGGASGASHTSSSSYLVGNAGSNSSISGTGITTITSNGGGYGGIYNAQLPSSGGSGGGAGDSNNSGVVYSGGAGTANQGYAGGSGVFNSPLTRLSGGGGGAGAVGVNHNTGSNSCGNGGAGLASSITGTSVTRAGGGGGGCATFGGSTPGSGGSGGGGAGGFGANGTSGTVNTGSGGGGGDSGSGAAEGGGGAGGYRNSYASEQSGGGGSSEASLTFTPGTVYTVTVGAGGASVGSGTGTSGAGGSGVVILRMPTSSYSGTTSGSPTVSTSGSDTILVYNSSGSYTG